MDGGRDDRSEAQAVETVVALTIGVAVFVAVVIASWLMARATGADPSAWVGTAKAIGCCAGVLVTGWRLARARREGL